MNLAVLMISRRRILLEPKDFKKQNYDRTIRFKTSRQQILGKTLGSVHFKDIQTINIYQHLEN